MNEQDTRHFVNEVVAILDASHGRPTTNKKSLRTNYIQYHNNFINEVPGILSIHKRISAFYSTLVCSLYSFVFCLFFDPYHT